MLQRLGLLHRKPGAHQHEQQQQKNDDQYLHGYCIADRGMGIRRLNMHGPQHCRNWLRKSMVQDFGKPELLRHMRLVARAPSD